MKPIWIIVTGDFTRLGGQDRANYELASYLANDPARELRLVCHRVADDLAKRRNVTRSLVARPYDSHLIGSFLLAARAKAIKAEVERTGRPFYMLVNGGNAYSTDANWVHVVHGAWPVRDRGAPLFHRVKNRFVKYLARRNESIALREARLIIANSLRTREQLISQYRLDGNRIHVVYLGSESTARSVDADARRRARNELGVSENTSVIGFVGSLGYDQNKGFDTALEVVRLLRRESGWRVLLVAVGTGHLEFWKRRVRRLDLVRQVRFLGAVESVLPVFDSIDLLISPSRYEAYGLASHEALVREIPAFINATSGLAERLPSDLQFLKLESVEDAHVCATRISTVFPLDVGSRDALRRFASELRKGTWSTMAQQIQRLVECGEVQLA